MAQWLIAYRNLNCIDFEELHDGIEMIPAAAFAEVLWNGAL